LIQAQEREFEGFGERSHGTILWYLTACRKMRAAYIPMPKGRGFTPLLVTAV
jgi:hypothetical protein